jgi:nucleoside-diphosphate-sugar epimerase
MTILVTGAGLIGTGFAREAIARGEEIIFFDPEPRADYLKFKLGDKGYKLVWGDVRDLPALVNVMMANKVSAVVHTAGLIGGKVQQSLFHGFEINLGGTRTSQHHGGLRWPASDQYQCAGGFSPRSRPRLWQLQGGKGIDP